MVFKGRDTIDWIPKVLEQFHLLLEEGPLLFVELGLGDAMKCEDVLEVAVQ